MRMRLTRSLAACGVSVRKRSAIGAGGPYLSSRAPTQRDPLTVRYRYSGNTDGAGAGNFAAQLDDTTGMLVGQIANDIATNEDKTTNLYPGNDNTPPFHFSVTADTGAKWTLTFICDAS
jgi:hypothetical protein